MRVTRHHARARRLLTGLAVAVAGFVPLTLGRADAAPQVVTVASGTVDASRTTAPKWRATTVVAPVTGSTTFTLTWTGTGDLDMSLKLLPSGTLVVDAVGGERPKTMVADLTAGASYQLAVWAQTGSGTYSVAMGYDDGVEPPPGGVLVLAESRVDATNATAPKWRSYPFTSPVAGEAEVVLTWTTPTADLRFTVKSSAGAVVASNLTAGAGPKTATVQLAMDAAYTFNVWAYSGASDFRAELRYEGGPPPGRPNIVIVNTDDQRADTVPYLQAISTRLAARGTTFTDAYVTTPACCPSRASLMSGRYVHNNGQYQQMLVGLDVDLTAQRYLHDSGYLTGHAGKFVHWWELADGVAPHWDRWTYFLGGYENVWMNFDGVTQQSSGYSTTIVFDRAIDYLDDFEQRDDERPWFLQLAPIAPHLPSTPEPAYVGAPVPAYVGSPATAEVDRTDKPYWVQNFHQTVETVSPTRAEMIRTLYTVDDGVDRLLDYLEAHDEMDDTLFVFTSDNGYFWAEHGLIEKFMPYPESVGVPLVMRWDGVIPAGAVDGRLVAQLDVTATVLAAAGVEPADLVVPIDGHDLLTPYVRQVALTEYWQDDSNSPVIPNWASITTAQYQFTEYYALADPTAVEFREYYDLVADPYLLVNLLADGVPGNDPDVAPLSALLAAHRTCAGSTCG